MRLINVSSLAVEEFFGEHVPSYGILSHTWGADEMTLQEWGNRQAPSVQRKSGYQKIVEACRLASAHGLDYVWADTNCIDKTSSAELSEAINSMFGWYRDARVCLVHLEDVVWTGGDVVALFQPARWFTRGWTLQELLAPECVEFYDRDWTFVTDKQRCIGALSAVTGIPPRALRRAADVRLASTAQRMSWLARRTTTRREDMAYCAFGLFGVHLPLLYGEGDAAFARLQEELIRSSHDHTIFCWSWPDRVAPPPAWMPALAPCAAAFADSGGYVQRPGPGIGKLPAEYAVTNVGIRIQLPILCSSATTCVALLEAQVEGSSAETCVAIALQRPATIWTSETVFWRARYPSSPIILPHGWAGAALDVRLAKPGAHPVDYGLDAEALTTLEERNSGWPRFQESKFALMILECLDAGVPTRPLCIRDQEDGGVVFMKPTYTPSTWCHLLSLSRVDKDRGSDMVTVLVQQRQDMVRWGAGYGAGALERQMEGSYGDGSKNTLLEMKDQVAVTVANDLELPAATIGRLAGARIVPVLIRHTHHYKERISDRIYAA
ncbi:HET domain [Cordyceps militaris]|uniref:HET domain n=1 Tax=Cordyceps militaris TaxID=73501 RepID=A0A2H4SJ55_CORMI|nr:HET domain [Cordyceps militaris]